MSFWYHTTRTLFEVLSDDVTRNPNASSLLFNALGIGTFLVFFCLFLTSAVWYFTTACFAVEKVIIRSIILTLFMITILILLFAQREPQYNTGIYERQVYDQSVIPRIAVGVVMIIFTVVAIILIIGHYAESRNLSTLDTHYAELWRNA